MSTMEEDSSNSNSNQSRLEKIKSKTFNQQMNDLQGGGGLFPRLVEKEFSSLKSQVKQEKAEILGNLVLASIRVDEVERFSREVHTILRNRFIELTTPRLNALKISIANCEKCIQKAEQIATAIKCDWDELYRRMNADIDGHPRRHASWKCARTLVKQGKNRYLPDYECGRRDFALLTLEHPEPVIWFLRRLWDAGDKCINYITKFEYVGMIHSAIGEALDDANQKDSFGNKLYNDREASKILCKAAASQAVATLKEFKARASELLY